MKKIIFGIVVFSLIVATAVIAYNKGAEKAINSINNVWDNGSHFIVEINGEYHQYEGHIGTMVPMEDK